MEDGLQYVAWRNNTFSLHVHVGVRGADRAVRVCDRLRPVLPELLALSANSPFLDGRDSGLHSARTPDLHEELPALRHPRRFRRAGPLRGLRGLPGAHRSIVEQTQIWWSVRPHHSFGTVELRICDAQTSAEDSTALAGADRRLRRPGGAGRGRGRAVRGPAARFVEENFWRAIRYGLDGKLIDLERREEYPAAAVADRLLAWTAPARAALGIEPALPEPTAPSASAAR